MLYAVPVCATIASGKITEAGYFEQGGEDAGREGCVSSRNFGKVFRTGAAAGFSGILDEKRPPFEDDTLFGTTGSMWRRWWR
jgi:xanthine dehydrogenase YagR molybdenum-binding subunit